MEESANFLLDFVELCQGTEIPSIFGVWTGLAGISAIVGRSCWVRFGTLTIFPNMYVCLVAVSGGKKSSAIELLEPILYGLEPKLNLIAQMITPQALIDAMRVIETTDTKHLTREKNVGYIILDELTSLLTETTYEGLHSLLLQFYNCKNYFEYQTKSGGKQPLKHTCLGIIAATTPGSLSKAIPSSAIGDGLTSRINLIYADERTNLVPKPFDTPEKQLLRERLVSQAARITMLSGELRLSKEADELCMEDYLEFHKNESSPFKTDPSLFGYANRHQGHILKVSALLCCSEAGDRTITVNHMGRAIDLVKQYELNLPKLTSLISSTGHGVATQQVLGIIQSTSGPIPRSDIMRKVSNKLSNRELDSVLETLERAKMIQQIVGAGNIFYKYLGGR